MEPIVTVGRFYFQMVCVKVVQKWRDSAGTSSALFTWTFFSSICQSTLRDIDKIISIIPKVHKILVCQLNLLLFNYLPPATKLGQGYIFTGVCDSVHREGDLPQCMLGYHTPPPVPGTPRPRAEHTGRYGQRAGGMHPTGMQCCFWLMIASIELTIRFQVHFSNHLKLC